jgi:hypothetical protein
MLCLFARCRTGSVLQEYLKQSPRAVPVLFALMLVVVAAQFLGLYLEQRDQSARPAGEGAGSDDKVKDSNTSAPIESKNVESRARNRMKSNQS